MRTTGELESAFELMIGGTAATGYWAIQVEVWSTSNLYLLLTDGTDIRFLRYDYILDIY